MNKSIMLPGPNGYDISVVFNVREEHESILPCLRGFGGGMQSPACRRN